MKNDYSPILYKVHIKRKPGTRFNPHHETWNETTCGIAYLKEGERAWLYCFAGERIKNDDNYVFLMHLSTVKNIVTSNSEIKIETLNTYYTLTKMS